MESAETLLAYHHKFRFLLEELSDESADSLKINRLVEEFQNEVDVYCYVSASHFKESNNSPFPSLLRKEDKNGERIKHMVKELDTVIHDRTKWGIQIMRLKEEVEKLLFQYEHLVGTNLYPSHSTTI
ncbi:hypothetical protein [Sediminicola sp. 1XM1-17]|uniref:hypothetical protein n=1 Tax=Sediminicola sp. 1XM1-17 TaxID=3127702 RepID=UPI00307822BC